MEPVHIAAQVKIQTESAAIEGGICVHPIAFVNLEKVVLAFVLVNGNEKLIWITCHNGILLFIFYR